MVIRIRKIRRKIPRKFLLIETDLGASKEEEEENNKFYADLGYYIRKVCMGL